MEKKEYLNEKKYQKNKKKITLFVSFLLIIGLCIGGGLIGTGLKKYSQSKLSIEEKSNYQTELDNYNLQLSSLKAEQNQELKNNGMSERYYNLGNEINKVEHILNDLENKLNPDTSYLVVFYLIGGFIILVTIIISIFMMTIINGREILAFEAQQVIPIAKEGIDQISPTIGNAAKNVASGIKKGLKDSEK